MTIHQPRQLYPEDVSQSWQNVYSFHVAVTHPADALVGKLKKERDGHDFVEVSWRGRFELVTRSKAGSVIGCTNEKTTFVQTLLVKTVNELSQQEIDSGHLKEVALVARGNRDLASAHTSPRKSPTSPSTGP